MAGLNDKQKRFVAEYLIDLNATQAAIRAGYSEKTARQQASDLLSKPNIQAAISKAMESRSKRTEVNGDRILLELARIGLSDVTKVAQIMRRKDVTSLSLTPTSEWDDDTRAAVSEISETVNESGQRTIKVKHHPKLPALAMLVRHLGLDKPELNYDDAIERMADDPDPERIDRGEDPTDG